MNSEDFQRRTNVSRETLEKLQIYQDRLRVWNKAINLVSKGTLENVWERHFLDSAQLLGLAAEGAQSWVDLGSGGGFPGLVIAILAQEHSDLHVTLVESDRRKCAFLADVSRETSCPVTIKAERVEAHNGRYEVISARALAPLTTLLEWSVALTAPSQNLLFPKGESVDAELTAAKAGWHMEYERIQSVSNPSATILKITSFSRRIDR